MIKLQLDTDVDKLTVEVFLPENLPGRFVWKEKTIELKSGKNRIEIR